MHPARFAAAAALVAGLLAGTVLPERAAADPASKLCSDWLDLVITARATEADPVRQAALDAAIGRFADESKGLAEDLRDLSKTLPRIEAAYEGASGGPLLDGIVDQAYALVLARSNLAFLGAIAEETADLDLGAAASLARQSVANSRKLDRIARVQDRAKKVKKLLSVVRKSDALVRKYGIDVPTP